MLKSRKIFLTLAIIAFVAQYVSPLNAQTDSPYSRYGLGALKGQATGASKGMGGVGYGLHTGQSANPLNPASYAQVDSLTFIFDIGVNYNNTSYKEGVNKASKSGGGLDYITILLPLSKQLGFSFGILPFSSTGYKLGGLKTVTLDDREVSYNEFFTGSGGLSQVYLGLGYMTPVKGLSVGFNASYLFGKLRHNNAITGMSEAADLPSKYTTLNVTTMKLDFGLQYKLNLADRKTLTLGAVYTPQMNSRGKLVRVETISSSSEVETVNDEKIATGTPHVAGFGFMYNHKGNVLLGADVTYENWKKVKFSDKLADDLTASERFNNKWKIAVGGEYRIAEYSKSYFQKIKFRGGLNYSNSYINVNTKEGVAKGFNEYGATIGFGFPLTDREDLGGRISYLNINFEYKYLKPELKSMVSERFFGVSLNVNINELWFLQRKIN